MTEVKSKAILLGMEIYSLHIYIFLNVNIF